MKNLIILIFTLSVVLLSCKTQKIVCVDLSEYGIHGNCILEGKRNNVQTQIGKLDFRIVKLPISYEIEDTVTNSTMRDFGYKNFITINDTVTFLITKDRILKKKECK